MSNEAKHISVLLNECIENLNIKPDGIYVDGTLGLGGHSEQILKRLDGCDSCLRNNNSVVFQNVIHIDGVGQSRLNISNVSGRFNDICIILIENDQCLG